MALDYMAIVSNGTYPTPTPTATQRAAFAVSWGLLSLLPGAVLTDSKISLRAVVLSPVTLTKSILRDINTGHRG